MSHGNRKEGASRPPSDKVDSAQPQTETRPAPSTTGLAKRIGQFRVVRVIASGGMGTVYEAMQEKPRRTVALKLMKRGVASRSALRRFEYESQILARLRHPGIAQVYHAGTHRDGEATVPYFAMEYIPNALSITKYVKGKKLGTRQMLDLFAQVCDAVHHGHQKGIIHRDLKPGNIMVDSDGQVKVIDFGVARSTDSDMAVTTLQTDVGQLIGTLQYMSPEQCTADPHDIDTRSDVYALGVVFYELLTGRLPYDLKDAAVFEAARVIREEAPTPPSTLNKALRGDVETIALKALEKERDRRYRSSAELADDIRRYLKSEPIIARPPSMAYQLRVFAGRHKGVIGAVAAVFVALLGGPGGQHVPLHQSRIRAQGGDGGTAVGTATPHRSPAGAPGGGPAATTSRIRGGSRPDRGEQIRTGGRVHDRHARGRRSVGGTRTRYHHAPRDSG
ncbi:MAG: serine/threonine protein kinase [Phycisphaerae bacterium]